MHVNDTTNGAGEYDPPSSTAEIYRDLEANEGAHHDLTGRYLNITQHAEQRFLERVDASEGFPRSRIEQEFHEAHRVELDDSEITDPTRIHPNSGVVYVFDPDDAPIITCFEPTECQLTEGNSPGADRSAVL
jgi:hypothetical protein